MNRARLWILLAVIFAFLAGGTVGVVAVGVLQESSPLSRPYANFEKRLSEELGLGAEERTVLRKILIEAQRSEEDVKNRHARHMEEDLARSARQADQLMREFVSCLTKDRQLRYEQLLGEAK